MADDGLLAQFDAQHGTKPDAATNGGPDLLAAFDKSLTAKPFGPGNPPPGAKAVQVPQPTLLSRLGDLLASTHEIPVVSGAERGAAAGGLDLGGGIENLVGGVPAAVGGALGHPELGDRFFQTGDYLRDLANQVAAAGPQTGAAGATQDIARGLAHYALGPELAAGAAATNAAAEGAQSGVPLGQQFKNAALEGALAEAGGRIPIAGKTLPAKLAAGAGLGLAFPFAEHAGQHYLVGNENVAPLPSLGELATSEAMMLALPALHAGGSKLVDMARGNAPARVSPPSAAPANDASTVEAALRASGLFTDAQIQSLKSDGSLGDIAAAATPGPRPPLAGPAPDAPLPVAAVRALPAPEPHQPAPLALPPPPRQLPAPTIAVDRAGNAITNAQAMDVARAADAVAQERAALGLTPDVERARQARIDSLLARDRAGVGSEPPVPPIPEGRFPEAGEPVAETPPEPKRQFRPVRAQNGQIMRDAKGRPLREPVLDFSRDHLLHWLAANGGINFKSLRESADVDPALLKDADVMRPFGRLGDPALRRNGGMTVDRALERMQEAGWLPQNDPNAPPEVGNNDATSMILDALNGHEITHPVEGVDERLQRRAAEHYADEARHEAAMAEDRAAQTEAERTHDLQALREHNAQFADADAGEALTVHQWIQRARDAGVPDESIRDALSREDWTPTLNRLIQERGNGTDTDATAVDLGRGNAPAGEGQVAEPGPAPHGAQGGDLFPAATGADQLRAAREAKDAERNGLTRPQQPFTNTDLGATPRGEAPKQARIPETPQTDAQWLAAAKRDGVRTESELAAYLAERRHPEHEAAFQRGATPIEFDAADRNAAHRIWDEAREEPVTPDDLTPDERAKFEAWKRGEPAPAPMHEVDERDLSPEDQELVQRTRARAAQAKDNRDAEAALEQDSRERGEREAGELGLRGAVVETLGPERVQNVHFVHDEDGLPANVRNRGTPIKRGNVRYGLHTADGHSYIFTKHANTPERAVWTAIHEVGGHEGIAALVREHPDVKVGARTAKEASESARKLFLQNPTVAKLAEVIGRQRGSKDLPRMAEEAMAELQAAKRSGRWDEIARKYGVDVPKSVRDGVQGAMANFVRRMKAIVNAIYRKLTGAKGEAFTDADVHDMLDRMWEAARGEHADVGEKGAHTHASEEPAERDLIAQHNTTAEKLAHADRMGGMAVPSIAVTRAGHPLEDFGDISLIGNKDIVDPRAGAKVFGADAYTPRYPDVKFKSDRDVALNVARIIGKRDGERLEVEAVGNAEDLTHSDAFKRYAEERLGNDYTYHEARALAENVLREAGAKELLFKGYTNAGYRRYVPHTLENVVKELKRNLRGGEGFNYGPGSVRAKFTPQFRSIEKIRAEKGRLVSKADFDKLKDEVSDDFFKVGRALAPSHVYGDKFEFHDILASTMQDAARMGVDRALRENQFHDVTPEARAEFAAYLAHLKNLPTHYFEAIQPRAVGIHEFKSAVVPSDATPATRALLQRHGLNVHEYERGNPEDRQRAIREAAENDDLLFSEEPQDRADTFGRGAGGAAVPEPVVEMPPRAPGESQKAYHARVIRENRATMLDGIKATVGLRTWTPEEKAQQTIGRGGMRAMWAKNQRAADKAAAAFHQAQRVFDKAGKSANLEAIHQWETGADIASASHRLFFKAMQAEFQKRIDAIRAISPGTLDHVIENYFPHLWEDPIKAGKWYQREFGKRPLEGNKSFLKQRVHATMKDGMAAGLKPVSTNPVDLVLAKMAQMDKFLALHEFRKDLQDRGWLKEMEPGERVPYGYARVDDPAFVKAAGLQGYFAVPEPIARDLNNYLSPSLYRFAPFKAFRRLQNLVMMARLGWSAFHAGFTTLDNLVMHADVGVRYALDGDIKRALITWAKTPLSVVWSPIEGGKLNRQWLGLDKADANTAALLDALEQGGAHYKMDTSEYNQGLRRFIRAFQQKDYGKSARAALSAAGEAGSWIIHHKLVPNQKMAARLLLAKSALDKFAGQLGKERGDYAGIIEAMHPDALRQIMGDVVKNVDDRLGQMNYDNQFWNKTAREAAQAMIGAVGWQVGTVRTVTGGVRDLQRLWSPEKLVSALDKGGKITDADMGRVTGRLTYLVSLALIMGGGNAALQYMMTGKGPSELKDYFFPKTGNKNADGSDERLQLPTYWMDHYKLATHPLQTAEHKIHPVFSMVMEAIANQDYWGVEIHDPHASWAKQAEQIGEYVAKGFLPYSVTNNQKARANEAGAGRQAASFFGVTTAPASVSRSKFQSFVAHNGNKGFGHEKRTAVDAEHSRTIKDIENQIRNGGESDLSSLNRKDLLRVRRESREEVPEIQFKKMDIEDKLDAWDMATPKERKEYHLRRDILTSHGTQTVRFRRLPADERHAVLERIMQVRDARSE